MVDPVSGEATPRFARLVAFDWLRGLVMALMAIDHSSDAFNSGRLFTDSALYYHPGQPLPAAQFLLRWVTHLCAPTFLFLAGVGLAFSIRKQRAQGQSELQIDRHLLIRGLLIAGFELWVGYFVMPPGKYLFQVLYAIGASYLFMIPLRRLGPRLSLGVAVTLLLTLEPCCRALAGGPVSIWKTVLFLPGNLPHLIVAYPALHWLALMLLGSGFGGLLLAHPQAGRALARKLLPAGIVLLGLFGVIRGLNAYGNQGLYRENGSLVQWLHVSKYPPGLSYVTLELGICFLLLAAASAYYAERTPLPWNPLLVFGQTPLFFYLLHFPLLVKSAEWLGLEHRFGIGGALLGALAVCVVLYPVCRWYRSYKVAHPQALTRFV